jgi:hypothetical protein
VRHPDLAEVVAYRIICICMFHSPKVQYTLFTHGPGSAVNVQSGAIRVVTASARSHSRDEGKKFGIERCSASRESQAYLKTLMQSVTTAAQRSDPVL